MNLVTIALSVGVLAFQVQPKDDKDAVVGMWKIDQKYGLAKESAEYGKPLDWIITFKKDGSYVWAQYDPYIEGVGRRHRDTKGTYIVNLRDKRLVLKTELMGKRVAFECILGDDGRSFVINQGEKHYNVYQDRRIKFWKIEQKPPVENKEGGDNSSGTTGGG